MKKIKFIIFSAFALFLTSCGDFLNESPRHDWDVDKAMTTYSSALQAVNGIYGRFMNGDEMNMGLSLACTNRSGLTKSTIAPNDWNFNYNQSNSNTDCWNIAYSMINAANFAINGIPEIADSAFPTTTAKNELVGEARFLRGYAYSILLLNYGLWWDKDDSKYGVVYRDQVTNASNVHQPRISVGESWKRIFEDLDFAIANMPDKFTSAKTASKFLAKAYKAKLLLIRGVERNLEADIKTAKTLIDDCIANIPAGIAVNSDMAEHFNLSWDSNENIFVRYLEDNALRTNKAGYTCHSGLGNNYSTNCIVDKEEVPQSKAICGLESCIEWMRNDPRWYVSTGKSRKAEAWDDTYVWTWKKIYRKGSYGGKQAPIDEKYAVYFMRLPELYIMQAELRARTGASFEESIAPINVLRSKRTNPQLPSVAVPLDEQELWDIIFQEYCKELIFENGSEYYASIRIYKNGHTYMEDLKGSDFQYDKTKRQYAVPHSEMINNKTLVGMQNPGQE